MQPPRQKLAARLVLGLCVAAGLAWLARLDYGRKISTDVLDLIPADERVPELATARLLMGARQARVALFALTVPAAGGADREAGAGAGDPAVQAFVGALAASKEFTDVSRMGDPAARNALGAYLFQHRLELLLPGWLAERAPGPADPGDGAAWSRRLAERTAGDLETFLSKPEALAFQGLLPSDPLLLMAGFADQAQGLAPAPESPPGSPALIWALAEHSPFKAEGQGPVFAAVDRALAAARAVAPGTTLQWTAISRFAADSRSRIEHEVSSLNVISLLAVLAVAAISVRRVYKALNLVPVVLCSLLGAWAVTTLVFARVHVLVFVVGSLLGGVAIDYGLYLYLQPPARPGETYRERVGRLLKPLLASALTAVIGFSLLLFSELPLIRELGVFVSAGLICALGAALLWFAQVDEVYLETRRFLRAAPVGESPRLRRPRVVLLALAAAVALLGPWRLRWHDDIRELEPPAPRLQAEADALRARFGESPDRTLYLTRGDTPAAARAALAGFLAWHARTFPDTAVASLGLALPTAPDWAALPGRLAQLDGFEADLRAALARHGFNAGEFEPFFRGWRELRARTSFPPYDELAEGLASALRGPLTVLAAVAPGSCWFATVAEHPPGADPPAATATVGSNQLDTINRLFGRYRVSGLRLSALGLGLVGLSVLVLYGPRRGARIFALPAGSCLVAFGAFGLAGHTMNLFHLLGAFLGVCLCHNYAIFSAENAARGDPPPPSIRLSGLTTAASFGVLALSQIPVVAALGSTVALIVVTALVALELVPFARGAAAD